MGITKATEEETESDLESRVDAALRLAFPFLPSGALSHQTTFSFQFGRAIITVDGENRKFARARADILVKQNGSPLAILELKRSGVALSVEDDQQGLSYARMLNPSPPLVVVSNGQDVRLLETHSGQKWMPAEGSDQALAALIQNAALVAKSDLKRAVDTLMGSNPNIWAQAVQQTSKAAIDSLSQGWHERLLPFVRDFCIPRKATAILKRKLKDGERLVIVEGQPQIGKSNVLREFTITADEKEFVVLFFDAGGAENLLQTVADILSRALNWPISKKEARNWLKNVSHGDGPILVLAIDGIGLRFDRLSEQISDLCSEPFGGKLAVVLELDSMIADRISVDSNGRRLSKIGQLASSLLVDRLDHDEYQQARRVLQGHHVGIMRGGHLSPELRLPWVLRAMGALFSRQLQRAGQDSVCHIPSVLGIHLLQLTRNVFKDDELRRQMRAVAAAILEDALDSGTESLLVLESLSTFAVLRRTLERHLSYLELDKLIGHGLLKPMLRNSGRGVLLVRLPELVASEAAYVLAEQLQARATQDVRERAAWLADLSGVIPFGDVVAAQAIIDNYHNGNGLSIGLIQCLLGIAPRSEALTSGAVISAFVPRIGVVSLNVREDGLMWRAPDGEEHLLPCDEGKWPGTQYSNLSAWLILSHLAGIAFAVVSTSEPADSHRGDPALLLEIGTCPSILRRFDGGGEMNEVGMHSFEGECDVVCGGEGIIEPITNSMLTFLGRDWQEAEQWIDEAILRNSTPLLSRISIALEQLEYSIDPKLSAFAQDMLTRKIRPMFPVCCAIRDHND